MSIFSNQQRNILRAIAATIAIATLCKVLPNITQSFNFSSTETRTKTTNTSSEFPRQSLNQTNQSTLRDLNGYPLVFFNGIIVTSAVDASGEPGLDFVVGEGRRGALIPSLTPGIVIEVVDNENWESHLEKGDTRRGYGNRVIIRTVDPISGEFVDLLYAHLDRVDVEIGQQVILGTQIGTQGRTGSTTGAHVSVDFFAPDVGWTTPAGLAMRDRFARQLTEDPDAFNQAMLNEQNH